MAALLGYSAGPGSGPAVPPDAPRVTVLTDQGVAVTGAVLEVGGGQVMLATRGGLVQIPFGRLASWTAVTS